ncbi:MAG: fluoride efflux transporter CrcB [Porticoccaceae bacterium]
MLAWFAVATGGALGALARFAVNGWLYPVYEARFPLPTLVINVGGSVVMGVLYVLIIERTALALEWRNFLMVGFLGAFTTFSTFSLEALALWQNGHLPLALAYIVASVFLSIGGLALAVFVTRLI